MKASCNWSVRSVLTQVCVPVLLSTDLQTTPIINSVLVERWASDKDAEKMPPLLLVMMMVMMVMPTISCSEEEDKGHGGRAWRRRRHCRPAD